MKLRFKADNVHNIKDDRFYMNLLPFIFVRYNSFICEKMIVVEFGWLFWQAGFCIEF